MCERSQSQSSINDALIFINVALKRLAEVAEAGRQAGRMQTCLYLHFGCAEHYQHLRLISWFGLLISTRSGSWQADMETSRKSHSGPNSSRWKSLHLQAFVYLSSDLWPFVDLSHLFSGRQICCQPPSESVTQNGHLSPPTQKELRRLDEIFRSGETLLFGNKEWHETGRFQLLTPVG